MARAFAFAASCSRFFGGALVSSERRRLAEIAEISSTAARKEASFAFEGLLKPLIFRTNWSEAARISSVLTGGSKLNRGLMFLHITVVCCLLSVLSGSGKGYRSIAFLPSSRPLERLRITFRLSPAASFRVESAFAPEPPLTAQPNRPRGDR
jgi:hypothetical protein